MRKKKIGVEIIEPVRDVYFFQHGNLILFC